MESAGKARSNADTRTADAMAERIREKRDNNLYRRERDGVEDKDRQDRRSAQRDVEEEADGSRSVAGKRSRDAEEATTAEENGGEGDRVSGGDPYRQSRGEERETRLPDNGVRQIGRSNRRTEGAAEISARRKKQTKRLETPQEGNGRRDRRQKGEGSSDCS